MKLNYLTREPFLKGVRNVLTIGVSFSFSRRILLDYVRFLSNTPDVALHRRLLVMSVCQQQTHTLVLR